MDRVRFGRALGFGARQAVKTLVAAADAVTAEGPSSGGKGAAKSSTQTGPRSPRAAEPQVPRRATGETPVRDRTVTRPQSRGVEAASTRVAQVKEIPGGVRRGSKRFGEAVWGRFVRLSGVLWLEVTGVFFGIFALFALGAVWRLRGDWHVTATNAVAHRNLLGAAAMLGVFGYFCASSFVRAKRRERGR